MYPPPSAHPLNVNAPIFPQFTTYSGLYTHTLTHTHTKYWYKYCENRCGQVRLVLLSPNINHKKQRQSLSWRFIKRTFGIRQVLCACIVVCVSIEFAMEGQIRLGPFSPFGPCTSSVLGPTCMLITHAAGLSSSPSPFRFDTSWFLREARFCYNRCHTFFKKRKVGYNAAS